MNKGNNKNKNSSTIIKEIQTNPEIEREIQAIIKAFKDLILGLEEEAKDETATRAYGGIIRAGKGKLVESIAKELVLIAWNLLLKRDPRKLEFRKKRIKVPINKEYITQIKNPDVKKYLLRNINKCYYLQKTDLHVYINNSFAVAIECKAYTENAMMKRILVDFTLLRKVFPNLDCVLFQLESQLGGDYSALKDNTLGSFPTHTLLSHFDINLHIITLLEGERKVDQPIHKKEFFKPLTKESLYKALVVIAGILKKHQ